MNGRDGEREADRIDLELDRLDGQDVQDHAVKFGILRETKYDPAVHGENDCDAQPGDDWFEFTFPPLPSTEKAKR